MTKYEKYDKTKKFIPAGMEHKNSGSYASLIQAQNRFLKSIFVIPLFGLHRDALETLVEPMCEKANPALLRQSMLSCPGIDKIEETSSTDKNGKWLIIAQNARKHQAFHYLDETLPKAFKCLQVLDLEMFQYDDFPYPRRGNRPLISDADVNAMMDKLESDTQAPTEYYGDNASPPPQKIPRRIEITCDLILPKDEPTNRWKQGPPNMAHRSSSTTTTPSTSSLMSTDIAFIVCREMDQLQKNNTRDDVQKLQSVIESNKNEMQEL